ncbi:hypothetical protein GEMRC1_011283 [Eukaryota sp. GEM-RC1]
MTYTEESLSTLTIVGLKQLLVENNIIPPNKVLKKAQLIKFALSELNKPEPQADSPPSSPVFLPKPKTTSTPKPKHTLTPKSQPSRTPRGEISQDQGYGFSPTTGFPMMGDRTPQKPPTPTERSSLKPTPSYKAPTPTEPRRFSKKSSSYPPVDPAPTYGPTDSLPVSTSVFHTISKYIYFLCIIPILFVVFYYRTSSLTFLSQSSSFITTTFSTAVHSELLSSFFSLFSGITVLISLNFWVSIFSYLTTVLVVLVPLLILFMVCFYIYSRVTQANEQSHAFAKSVINELKKISSENVPPLPPSHLMEFLIDKNRDDEKLIKRRWKKIEVIVDRSPLIAVSQSMFKGIKRKCWQFDSIDIDRSSRAQLPRRQVAKTASFDGSKSELYPKL